MRFSIKLSHGMKQKAIISAMIHEPKLLILDELVGLDPRVSSFYDFMREMCSGRVVFFLNSCS